MGYFLLAGAYAAFAAAVFLFEARRVRRTGPDAITLFVGVFLLQCVFAAIVVYATLPFVDVQSATGNSFADRILASMDIATAWLVLCLTVWFVIFFYVGCATCRMMLPQCSQETGGAPRLVLDVSLRRLLLVLLFGLALSLASFYLLGDSLVARYTNLILFRNNVESIERNALNANAFSLTQSWSWLAVLAVFVAFERRGRGWIWLVCLLLSIVFALLGVSRRALFLPLLIGYLVLVLFSGRWRLRWLVLGALPLTLVLAYGKDALAALAYGGTVARLAGSYDSWLNALLRAAADTGLTVIESLGTLTFIDIAPRFGVDHLLSMAQRFPEGMLGLNFNFPERIVRVSTETFADAAAQDIPPGLMGQMWLDFRLLGPVIWGLVFGPQLSVVQYFFERTERTLSASAVFVLLVFVIALPLNTGSFDFTFSVDIFALALGLLLCVRLRHRRLVAVA